MNRQILHNINLKALLCLTVSCLCVSTLFAANLVNQSMENMQVNYWGLNGQFGTTFSTNDVQGEDSGYENIPMSQVYRQNMSIVLPSGYSETTNGNFSLTGTQYAIVGNPKNLNSQLTDITDVDYMGQDLNRLVMNNVASGKDILTFNIKNYDKESTDSVSLNIVIDEVSNSGSGSAGYSLFIGSDNIGSVEVSSGVTMNYLQIGIPKEKLSNKFTLSLRRTDTNAGADGLVLAFSEILMTGKAKVVSGVSIAITDDEGSFLGSKVTIQASAAEGIEDNDVLWESKSVTEASWTELNYKGLTLVDAPKKAGITLYRAKYNGADNPQTETEWVYSNEVSVTRIQACDGKLSNQLFFENFGTVADEKDHKSCQYVPSGYNFMAKCKALKNGGEYAVVANAKWAGCTKEGEGEGDACREDAENYWFRDDLRSVGGEVNGGMLLLNCKDGGPNDILYKREVSVNCPNTTVTFSFFVAQASKSAQSAVRFQVQLVAGDVVIASEEYDSGTLTKDDGWKAGSMQFNTGSSTTFEIRVVNYAAAGSNGNDLLLDNLAFAICTTEVSLDKEASSPGAVVGKRVVAECGTEVTLQADADAAGINDPYYLWVVRENSGEFKPDATRSGANINLGKFTPTEDKKYSTYVILAQDETTATKYFNGEDIGCSPVSVTDTMAVVCSIPSLEYTRECDKITLEALINPGDVVTWFKSENGGISWDEIGKQTASAKDISLKKIVDITKDTQFKIETVGEGGIKTDANTEVVTFHNIKLTVTDKATPVTTPETTTIEISKGGCAYLYPQYTGYDITPTTVDKAKIVGSDGSQSEINITDNNKEICDIEKAVTYYAEYDGCQSNSVAVSILGTVDIELVSRDCNTAVFKAVTLAPEVQWYYLDASGAPVPVGEPQPASNTFTYVITEEVSAIKASIGSGASIVYSDELYEPLYNLKMEGKYVDETYAEGETITVDYDGEVTLSISQNSYIGDEGKAQFFTADGTLVDEKDVQFKPQSASPVAEYTFNAQKSGEYYIKVNGCQTGTIKVVVKPEVSFTYTSVCSHYSFKAEVKGEGTIEWFFDDLSQNPPVKIPGTDGKLEIEFDAPQDGVVMATYGGAGTQDEVFGHSITLDADPKKIEKGEVVTFTVTPNEGDWLTDVGTELYKVNGGKVGNRIYEPNNTWSYSPEVTASYYAKTEDGCQSNEVSVMVGSVSMSYTNSCNTYTLKAITEGEGTVVWQKNGVDIPGSEGKAEYVMDITEDVIVRAKFGEFYSEENTLTYYSLALKADPEKIETCGADAQLTATMTPMSLGIYSFYKKGESSAIYEGQGNSCSTGPLYSSTTFVVRNQGCEAEVPVNVDLVWPTVFTPYTSGSTNGLFEVCVKSMKIFDRNGNMIADIQGNTWDGYCNTGSSSGNMAMPGVYFYVATLNDDTIKKGTVEIFKSKDNK
ncbi:MAG: gliding motility-associated C-terminal domain-containing protein [Paludibacteraceae bacterium]|nr:gliding motility-associated C-terminal domain-containing protein [Paludibacteraceae bacterium]